MNVTGTKVLKYNLGGTIFFKTSFAEEQGRLPLPRNDATPMNVAERLYSDRLKIKQTKHEHLVITEHVAPKC